MSERVEIRGCLGDALLVIERITFGVRVRTRGGDPVVMTIEELRRALDAVSTPEGTEPR